MADGRLRPAFYAAGGGGLRDWWTLLHPPYTLWHLSYVVIGACLAPLFSPFRLTLSVAAFFLGVGIAAHALDELNGRPLKTEISSPVLVVTAVVAVIGAVALGVYGITLVGVGLIPVIAAGVILVAGYNLEWFGGRLHNDLTFALSWGSFPLVVSYFAQAERIDAVALLGGAAAFSLSWAQRALSTPARLLRRRVAAVEGTLETSTGEVVKLDRVQLLRPLEQALRALTWAVVAVAGTLLVQRLT